MLDLINIPKEPEHPNSLRFSDAFNPGQTDPSLYQDLPFPKIPTGFKRLRFEYQLKDPIVKTAFNPNFS